MRDSDSQPSSPHEGLGNSSAQVFANQATRALVLSSPIFLEKIIQSLFLNACFMLRSRLIYPCMLRNQTDSHINKQGWIYHICLYSLFWSLYRLSRWIDTFFDEFCLFYAMVILNILMYVKKSNRFSYKQTGLDLPHMFTSLFLKSSKGLVGHVFESRPL